MFLTSAVEGHGRAAKDAFFWPASSQSGQLEQARAEAAEVMRINPGFTIESAKRVVVYKDPEDAEHRLDGMRKAGPES